MFLLHDLSSFPHERHKIKSKSKVMMSKVLWLDYLTRKAMCWGKIEIQKYVIKPCIILNPLFYGFKGGQLILNDKSICIIFLNRKIVKVNKALIMQVIEGLILAH